MIKNYIFLGALITVTHGSFLHSATEGEHIVLERSRACSHISKWKACGIATVAVASLAMSIGGRIASMPYVEYPGWSLLAVDTLYLIYKGWPTGIEGVRARSSSYDRSYTKIINGDDVQDSTTSPLDPELL